MSTDICYWCGEPIKDGEGNREHLVPKTILQDAGVDISEFIALAHKSCNSFLADNYEHDFCQIIFHYAAGDPRAAKHTASKLRNLKRHLRYAWNQFRKMRTAGNMTIVDLDEKEKSSFEMIIKKILKGLYFKLNGKYLDTDNEYIVKIVWSTLNLEKDEAAANQTKMLLSVLNGAVFAGNSVFEYRFKKADDSTEMTSVWEFLFYHRFPVYLFLVHKNDKEGFKNLELLGDSS